MNKKTDNKDKISISSKDVAGKLDIKISEIKIKEKEDITQTTARTLGVPYINLHGFPIQQDALRVIDEEDSKKYKIICFFYGEKQIRVGVVDIKNKDTKEFVLKLKEEFLKKDVLVHLISENSFNTGFKMYSKLPKVKEVEGGIKITQDDIEKYKDIKDFRKVSDYVKRVSLTDILNLILSSAINVDASDIHIETEKERIKIRFRIDGILHDVAEISIDKWGALISRIKLISGLKINIVDKPQDGNMTIMLGDSEVDIRVSTLPTAYGESVSIRILMFSKETLTLEEIGLGEDSYKILEKGILKPNGMILNTGPTGSGKTTTLYAIINKLNKEGIKIITVEDPIEYHLDGINQSEVDVSKGYTFAKALRSIVRQDPDIVMVGEIRDLDTVDTSIQASLTGHLVLSTVHTNSASASIPRLISMGAKSFLLAPALNTIIGQRLVRRVCVECRESVKIDERSINKIKDIFSQSPDIVKNKIDLNNLDKVDFYKSKGCDKCGGTGYKGRVAVFEVINFDEDMKALVSKNENVSEDEIKKSAIEKGMITMAQDGILKAIKGITTIDDVFRVTG